MDKILHDVIYLNYGIYGAILYLGSCRILSISSIHDYGPVALKRNWLKPTDHQKT